MTPRRNLAIAVTAAFLLLLLSCRSGIEEAVHHLEERGAEVEAHGTRYTVVFKGGVVSQLDIAAVCELPTTILFLYDAHIVEDALRSLDACNSLEKINLDDTAIGEGELAVLARIPALKTVLLRGNLYGDEDFALLADCRSLEFIGVQASAEQPGRLTNRGVEQFADRRRSTTGISLDFTEQPGVDNRVFESLLRIENLKQVTFQGTHGVTREGYSQFSEDYEKRYGRSPFVNAY